MPEYVTAAPFAAPAVRPRTYTRTAIALHWIMTVFVLCNIVLGADMVRLGMTPLKLRLFSYHKWIGITVLGLVLIRGTWRLTHAVPADEPMPRWQRRAAHLAHGLLYALMLAVPLLGWTYSSASGYPVVYLKLWQLPDLVPKNAQLAQVLMSAHIVLAWTLAGVVAVHAAGALKHHFIDRDATLRRMLNWRRG
jgi:cytochrome b561